MTPPRLADRLLWIFCAPHLREEVLGDLHERYVLRAQAWGEANARRRYWREVLAYVRPAFIKRQPTVRPLRRTGCDQYPNPTYTDMLRNYVKIAFRGLVKNKVYSSINIGGLAVGMAVAMLIGLWIYDELSYNESFQNYGRIAKTMQNLTYNGQVGTQANLPYPMGDVLRTNYGSDRTGGPFKRVVMSSNTDSHILAAGDKKFTKFGNYMEPEAPELLTLHMLSGTRAGLKDPGSILLSESVAKAYFGDADPVGKQMKIDSRLDVNVTGVYEDFSYNSDFKNVSFIAPWELYLSSEKWIRGMSDSWGWNAWFTYVQLADHADIDKVSAKIRDIKRNRVSKEDRHYKPEIFLEPMQNWHLYSDFKNGVHAGGLIEFVWLFGLIGIFVLLLACINFMNLSTARSEKRAKEVGIRKAVGSVRSQLISQFFSESLLVVAFAFVLALVLVQVVLPAFNTVADKKLAILWSTPWFWLLGIGFSLLTGFIAGSYPAFYLSSFQPVKVLKGTFKMGRFAAIPRKVLVVVQFTVSVVLIIGTIIVFRQIQFAKNRPVGYERNGLVMAQMVNREIHNHFDAFRNELKRSGYVAEVAESKSPVTDTWSTNGNIDWKGKDPNLASDFPNTGVSVEYGKTVGWKFQQGRDFSREFTTDSSSFVINEAAVKFMGLKNPFVEIVRWGGRPFKVIGVIKDMIVDSPYQPVRASLFHLSGGNFVVLKIDPTKSVSDALGSIETIFKKYDPDAPFDYQFVDQEYAKKFGDEERIGKLASFFAVLAIFISCLGLFGLASFVAEQRTKEIGVRKVLGATVFNLWGLLSKDFVYLVLVAFFIATPIAYYFLGNWLQRYTYRTDLSWWIFAASGAGALIITLLTVSFQSIKAALMNPVKSLRSE